MEASNPHIETFTGRNVHPLHPRASEICIEDIAHGLSHQCRFTGQCLKFFSVAEHSIEVSRFCSPEDALWGLLHDASEAYLCDLSRPIKQHSGLGTIYREIEAGLMRVICERFGLPLEMPRSVHRADSIMLHVERGENMHSGYEFWPSSGIFNYLDPIAAETIFLVRYEGLLALQPRSYWNNMRDAESGVDSG